MPTLKDKHSPASINLRLAKLFEAHIFDCIVSDTVKHFLPHSYSVFKFCKKTEKQGEIIDMRLLDTHEELSLSIELENEFFDILQHERIVDVFRNKKNFTPEQNEQIDIICYCNRLKVAAMQGQLTKSCKIDFSKILNDTKLASLINALENYPDQDCHDVSPGWASLAAALLLANVIKTNVDLSEKTTHSIDEYWSKRLHDSIGFAIKAAESLVYKKAAHALLLHIKAVAGEYYPDIKQRISIILIEPNIEAFTLFKRAPLPTLLKYQGMPFTTKPSTEKLNSQDDKKSAQSAYSSLNRP